MFERIKEKWRKVKQAYRLYKMKKQIEQYPEELKNLEDGNEK